MDEHVAELAALVDRAGRRDADVARHAARRRELAEEPRDARLVLGDARGRPRSRCPRGRRSRGSPGPPCPGPGEVDHVGVGVADEPVEVDVDQAQAGRRAPVAEQPRLDVLRPQRLAQQRVVLQVDLADGQVVGGAPVREVHPLARRRSRRGIWRTHVRTIVSDTPPRWLRRSPRVESHIDRRCRR